MVSRRSDGGDLMKWLCPNCWKNHAEHTQGDVNICFRMLCEKGVGVKA